MTVARLWTIPPGVPFLPTLARTLSEGRLVPGFCLGDDPLALSDATIFVPTRRAARELRASFVELFPGRPLVLPTIRALGEFDADDADFSPALADAALPPPIPSVDRLLLLAPLVQRWKNFLPGKIRSMFQEEVEIPVSSADAVWLARDLAALMDEIETEETDWGKLAGIAGEDLSGWWSVTLDFLGIVSAAWPEILKEKGRSNPAAHRNLALRAEAERLVAQGSRGPVVAAGSVACNPATAALLGAVANLSNGAVVLPGLDGGLDARSWDVLCSERPEVSVLGHPQFGLAKMLRRMKTERGAVAVLAEAPEALALRGRVLSEALRPAATTDAWAERRGDFSQTQVEAAFAGVTLVEAAHERDEALAIAIALRQAVGDGVSSAALATADRALARRVSAELARFGIRADDSGGTPLTRTPPGQLLTAMLEAVFRPGDAVAILSLIKHPLLGLGLERRQARRAAEAIELLAFRGGAGRPDITEIAAHLDKRLQALADDRHRPFWLDRMGGARLEDAGELARRLEDAVRPLLALRGEKLVAFSRLVLATVESFEALGRDGEGGLDALYGADAGRVMAAFLRELVAAEATFALDPAEWPSAIEALAAETVVRPLAPVADRRVTIWGLLEARLQHVDTLVLGGLNEGAWPVKAQSDRFMSRFMKSGIELEPPENRIGLAAHDFQMAMGQPRVLLTRAARQGDAPAVASRWLQRLTTFLGKDAAPLKARGDELLALARGLDEGERIAFEPRPAPKPPVEARPRDFSVTEIEILRRDPYALYAKRVLKLEPIEPLIREPGPAERGTLFHRIMDRWTAEGGDAHAADARGKLLAIGQTCFDEADLPDDVRALWWPRFERMTDEVISWERGRAPGVAKRFSEVSARKIEIGDTGTTLRGRADRIDVLADGRADILDFKTGSNPTKAQAHSLLAPQMALEGALLRRGAFEEIGAAEPADLLFVRLKPDGTVEPESILTHNRQARTAEDLSQEAWERLEHLIRHYQNPDVGYLSRTLPFKEGDASGPYDHLARVLEWSAGGGEGEEADA
ncbi:MAG TPA: double-strand break repair protein AddB [Mesorhizobium sp.]|jgi:ATP-dependent helicase/nuclease subunit B|nr:double-strand break repair protein AddB [Mesorhizobium sp.]